MTGPESAAWTCCGVTYKGGTECPKCLTPKPTTAASIPYEDTDCTADEAVEAVQAVRATAARQAGVADLAEARQVIAEQIDLPSVYMGGPSSRATRAADDVLDALTGRGFLLYRVDIPEGRKRRTPILGPIPHDDENMA